MTVLSSNRSRKVIWCEILIFLSLFSLCLFQFAPLVYRDFSVIDEHAIATMLPKGEFDFDAALLYLSSRSDYYIGETGRFRPFLFPILILQFAIFTENVWAYFLLNSLSFFLFSCSIYIVFSRAVGSLVGFLIVCGFLSYPSYSDIVSRIISSETSALLPLAILIFSAHRMAILIASDDVRCHRYIKASLIAYFVSSMVLIGLKENFVFLLLITVGLLLSAKQFDAPRKYRVWLIVIFWFQMLFCLTILLVIGYYFASSSETLAGFGLNTSLPLQIARNFVEIVGPILVIPLILLGLKFKTVSKSLRRVRSWYWASYLSLLLAALFINIVYYSGNALVPNRYGFLTILIVCSMVVFIAMWIQSLDFKNKGLVAIGFVIFSLNPWVLPQTLQRNFEFVSQHAQNTVEFQALLHSVVEYSRKTGVQSVLVSSSNVWDYELISSLFKFLKAKQPEINLSLSLNYECVQLSSPVEKLFCNRLKPLEGLNEDVPNWYSGGQTYFVEWGYSSAAFSKNACVEIGINKVSSANEREGCADFFHFNFQGR